MLSAEWNQNHMAVRKLVEQNMTNLDAISIPLSWFTSSGQNGHHFAGYIIKCIVMNGQFCITIPKGPIDNKSTLVR